MNEVPCLLAHGKLREVPSKVLYHFMNVEMVFIGRRMNFPEE
jgi:hypothetical protein